MILAWHKDLVVQFVASRLGHQIDTSSGFEALGSTDASGRLIGGVVYVNYRVMPSGAGADVELIAAGSGAWLTKPFVRELFAYPFEQLSCLRVTALVGRKNRASRTLVEKLGFRLEGVVRDGFGQNRDAMLYGMLKRECKWIASYRKEGLDGQGKRAEAA